MSKQRISLALGTFDGMHAGHMRVIHNALSGGLLPAVLLFKEHPSLVINGSAPPELMPKGERDALLKELGMNIIEYDFAALMHKSAEEFFYEILVGELGVGKLSCGENYSFGYKGAGTPELLKTLCEKEGIELDIAKTLMYDGEPVSSTRIRDCLKDGDVEAANNMLERDYSFTADVIHGDERGRKLGFPTANQDLSENVCILKHGVYASYVHIENGLYPSVTNIGIRPTVDGTKPVSETHVFGYDGELYEKSLQVFFIKRIRDEQKFASLDELSKAIERDTKEAKKLFENHFKLQ